MAAVATILSPPLRLTHSPRPRSSAKNRKLGSSLKLLTTGSGGSRAGSRGTGLRGDAGGVVFLSPPSSSQSDKVLDKQSAEDSRRTILAPEDVTYLWKLLGGSVGGGFIIKYGSVLFPDITRPNLWLALTMIVVPVIFVSVLILIRESSSKEEVSKM